MAGLSRPNFSGHARFDGAGRQILWCAHGDTLLHARGCGCLLCFWTSSEVKAETESYYFCSDALDSIRLDDSHRGSNWRQGAARLANCMAGYGCHQAKRS